MANIAIFRINYKSDFILTLNSDAGWMTPFCIKFWTGAPSQAYFVGFDGTTYTHCAPVAGEPTKLLVQFDDHHLPIGDLKFQIGYHFTVADFPTSVEDEVINQASVIIEVDDAPAQVMLDLNGETAPEIEFSLPAYANEAQRIANEEQRIANEQQRILQEQQRIEQEGARVVEFGQIQGQAVADHRQAVSDHGIAVDDHTRAESDHGIAVDDHTQAGNDHTRAGEDHTRAESDHTRAESDHDAVEVFVESLGAFDLSQHNAVGGVLAKYATLQDAITALNALPASYKYGGMSFKFVQSSDNNYKRFDLIADEFTTDVTQWQGVDEELAENNNLIANKAVAKYIRPDLGESDKLQVCDDMGNVAFSIGEEGITAKKADIDNVKSKEVADKDGVEFTASDEEGNVAFSVNSNGVNAKRFNICDVHGHIIKTIDKNTFDNIDKLSYENNLKNQNVIYPIIGSYGNANAVYMINPKDSTYRIKFDFTINDDLNDAGITDAVYKTICKIGTNLVQTKALAATPLAVTRNHGITAHAQVVGCRSGFKIIGTEFVRTPSTKKPLVGKPVFVMWLKGSFTESNIPSASDVATRSSWIADNRDIVVTIANDTFTVAHSGQDDNGNSFGTASTIFTTSLKSGGSYKTLKAFYTELTSATELADFAFKIIEVVTDKTCKDLLQFGTIPLVARYYQQTDPSQTEVPVDKEHNWDSFPLSLLFKKDETLHTCEIVKLNSNLYVSVDGEWASVSYDDSDDIFIGGTELANGGVTPYNLVVNMGSTGDAVINSTYGIVSKYTPRIVGVMTHKIYTDRCEGDTMEVSYYSTSSREIDVYNLIHDRNYNVLTISDLADFETNQDFKGGNCIFTLATQLPVFDNYVNDINVKNIISRYNMKFNLGTIIKKDLDETFNGDTDDFLKASLNAKANGFSVITHGYTHDMANDHDNSMVLQQKLFKLIRLCISCGVDSRVFSYDSSCESPNYFNMLSYNGFVAAITDTNGNTCSVKATNPYILGRGNFGDGTAFSTIKNILF